MHLEQRLAARTPPPPNPYVGPGVDCDNFAVARGEYGRTNDSVASPAASAAEHAWSSLHHSEDVSTLCGQVRGILAKGTEPLITNISGDVSCS